MAGQMTQVGSFWLNTSKAGKKYMSGSIDLPNQGRVKVVMFKNDHKKEGETSPDYKLFLSEDRQQSAAPQSNADYDDTAPF